MTWLGTQVEQQRRVDTDEHAAAAASASDTAGEATDGEEWHATQDADQERRNSSAGASTSGRMAPLPSVRWLQRLRGFRDKQDRGVRSRKVCAKWWCLKTLCKDWSAITGCLTSQYKLHPL